MISESLKDYSDIEKRDIEGYEKLNMMFALANLYLLTSEACWPDSVCRCDEDINIGIPFWMLSVGPVFLTQLRSVA